MLVGDLLRKAAERRPQRTAITCEGARLDYAGLDAAADRFAAGLHGLGVGSGKRIAILATNRPEYAAAYFGAARSGAVLAHLSFRATDDDIAYMLAKTAVELVVVEAPFLERVLDIRDRLPGLAHVVGFGGDGPVRRGIVGWDDLLAGAPARWRPPAIVPEDPFGITFTGGTTGLPKAVLVSHRSRVVAAEIAAPEFGLSSDDVFAVTTPLFHSAGLFIWYQPAVMLGASCAFMPTWSAESFLQLVEREGVSAAFLVPTQLNDLLRTAGFAASRLENLKKLNFAGAPMPPALFERARAALPWVEMTEHYGQSEACPLTVRKPTDPADKVTSVGRACRGIELAVMDRQGRILPPGETGDVVTRGDHLLSRYDGDEEQTASLYRNRDDGWLLTGDVGVIDQDGFLTLVDRAKDMIIAGGENIYPTEIENALYTHPAVAECAVFGVPDDHWGEIPAAHVVCKDGATVTEQELIDHCAAHIARHKRPRFVKFVDALPKTAVGKVQKSTIRAPYWQDRT